MIIRAAFEPSSNSRFKNNNREKHMKKIHFSVVSTSVFLGFLLSVNAQAASQYILEDLGKIPAGTGESIHVNDIGHYTIPVLNADNLVDVYLNTGTEQVPISGFGFNGVKINDLNNNGHAVGSAISDPLTSKVSALYFDGVNSHNIETLPGIESTANAINDHNLIVGEIRVNDYGPYSKEATRAIVYDLNNQYMQILDDLANWPPIFAGPGMALANSINDAGMITGGASSSTSFCNGAFTSCEAYTFDGTSYNTLGHLRTDRKDDVTSIGEYSVGQAVNIHGHVAGYSDRINGVVYSSASNSLTSSGLLDDFPPPPFTYPDPYHVFFHDGTEMKDLGTLSIDGRDVSAFVSEMNDTDRIVGHVLLGEKKAFMVTPHSTMTDLNDLLPTGSEWSNLSVATDINNHDVIVGYGIKNGETHAFKLRPATAADMVCMHAPDKACEIVRCRIDNVCN